MTYILPYTNGGWAHAKELLQLQQPFSISTLPALIYDLYFFFTMHRFLKNEMP